MENLFDGMKNAYHAIVVLEEASGEKCPQNYFEKPKIKAQCKHNNFPFFYVNLSKKKKIL